MTSPKATDRSDRFNYHIKGILDHYRIPLIEALQLLVKEGYSTQKLADRVFKGQLSREAVNLYLKKDSTLTGDKP